MFIKKTNSWIEHWTGLNLKLQLIGMCKYGMCFPCNIMTCVHPTFTFTSFHRPRCFDRTSKIISVLVYSSLLMFSYEYAVITVCCCICVFSVSHDGENHSEYYSSRVFCVICRLWSQLTCICLWCWWLTLIAWLCLFCIAVFTHFRTFHILVNICYYCTTLVISVSFSVDTRVQ